MKRVIIVIIQKMKCSNSKDSNRSKNCNGNSSTCSNICYSFIDLLQGLRFGGFRDQGFGGFRGL